MKTKTCCFSSLATGWGLLLLVAGVLSSGCATANRVPIASATQAKLGSVDGIVGTRQQEIGTDINRSNSAAAVGYQFGAIGGLITGIVDSSVNNSRAKKAEITVAPVRDALVNYHPCEVLATSLNKKFAGMKGFAFGKIESRQITDQDTVSSWVDKAKGTPLLIVQLDYRFTPDFGAIVTTATISLHGGNKIDVAEAKTKSDLPPVVYYNIISSSESLPGGGARGSQDESLALWAKDNGQAARTAFDRELNELAEMIAYDLTAPGTADNALYKNEGAEKRSILMGGGAMGRNGGPIVTGQREGYIERKAEGRAWVRMPGGELCAAAL